MVCPQCNAKTKGGRPCKLHTCKYAPKCHHHTPLRVGVSNIPGAGRGLFARKAIKKGEVFGDYRVGTQELTAAQFRAKYPSGRASHVWAPRDNGPFYDGSNLQRSVAGAANRGRTNNAKINANGKLVAKQSIRAGKEITVGYGASYRL